jgi:hypothetical protein
LAKISAVATEMGVTASGSMIAACTGGGGASVAAGAVPVQATVAAPTAMTSAKWRDEHEESLIRETCVWIFPSARRKKPCVFSA